MTVEAGIKMQKFSLLYTILYSLTLASVTVLSEPYTWVLGPEMQKLTDAEQNFVIEHLQNIDAYHSELMRLNIHLIRNPNDVDALTDKEYFLDVLAAEEGILTCIRNRIISCEPIEWELLNNYVTNLKLEYLTVYISLYRCFESLNMIEARETTKKVEDRKELQEKINSWREERHKYRDSVRSGELLDELS